VSAFKAYDIRGIFGRELLTEDVFRIGFYLPELMNAGTILVGRDCRLSSPEVCEALCEGIITAGANVHYAGLATTPMIYYLTAKYDYAASVQVTASHNSREYNGLKISGRQAMPVGKENGLGILEQMILRVPVPGNRRGRITDLDCRTEYFEYLRKHMPEHALKLTIDSSNGMAGLFIRELTGSQAKYINLEPDGNFPNHDPNPLDKKNLEQLSRETLRNGSDLGIIFDGDADRVAFVDELGNAVSPDLVIAVLGHVFLQDCKGKVLVDIRTSRSVADYLKPMGGNVIVWKVGRAFASPKLRQIDGIYGGELAGHYYFRDFYYSDSGLLGMMHAINVFQQMHQAGIRVSECISRIATWAHSGEINFRIAGKERAITELCRQIRRTDATPEVMDFDGIRYDYTHWWFNIRASNTEPYLRLVVEADRRDLLEEKTNLIQNILRPFETEIP